MPNSKLYASLVMACCLLFGTIRQCFHVGMVPAIRYYSDSSVNKSSHWHRICNACYVRSFMAKCRIGCYMTHAMIGIGVERSKRETRRKAKARLKARKVRRALDSSV